MNILVTGSSGYIGSILCNRLKKYHYVIGVDRKPGKFTNYKKDATRIDVLNYDIVVHLAGNKFLRTGDSLSMWHDNFQTTYHLLKENPQPYFIYASSAAVYGKSSRVAQYESDPTEPISVYGKSKLASELLIQSMSTNYCIMRFFNVSGAEEELGNNNKDDPSLIASLLLRKKVTLNANPRIYRDFIHVSDLVDAIEVAIEKQPLGIFNIGSCIPSSLGDVAREVARVKDISYALSDEAVKNEVEQCVNASIDFWHEVNRPYPHRKLREIVESQYEFYKARGWV
jgi:nucleoside-diphosphate-sugar epimerase